MNNDRNDMTVQTEERTEEQTEKAFGKFGTADELLAAYNALESEFTKRCQLLKQLQAELNVLRAQADTDSDGDGECGAGIVAGQPEEAPMREVDELAVPDEILKNMQEYAEILSEIPEIMNACIARYKKNLLGRGGYRSVDGAAVIVPAKRPRSLSEAKALADKLLN